jgi:hypothetical protein
VTKKAGFKPMKRTTRRFRHDAKARGALMAPQG